MKKSQEIPNNFHCELCDYNTSNLKDYNKHLLTAKHLNRTNLNDLEQKKPKKSQEFICKYCDKSYIARNSLWYHQKKCHETSKKEYIEEQAKNITDKDELIMFLIKECTDYKNIIMEQQSMMMKVIENGVGNNIQNNTTYNNNNKTFNLQVFLNETCKDAMNINDFVDSIKLQLTDLEKFAEVGYVEGISNIITTNLKVMDITQRPVHCTDKKRETVYIKDENQWIKEDENKTKLRKAIRRVSNKNINLLPQFREKYPEYKNSSSKVSDKYDKMVIEVMTTDTAKEDKVIRNISNVATIDKMIK
jgi:hypothetical protein